MARVLYFDCFSGISGDMVLGAFLDAGLPLADLQRALGSLALSGVGVSATRVLRAGVSATKFVVHEGAGGVPDTPAAPGAQGDDAAPHHHHDHDHRQGDHQQEDHRHDHQHGDHQHGDHRHGDHQHDHQHGDHHHGDHQHGTDAHDVHQHNLAEHRSPEPSSRAHESPGHGSPEERSHQPASDRPSADRTAHHHAHRSLPEIFRLIDTAALSASGRDRAKAMFQRLGEAEAAIHQMPVEKVHLHEVGAIDSIIDIVGAVFALEWAGADHIVCSPLNIGGGMVQSAHGLFPVPAPATVRLLGSAPVYSGPIQKELVTPTGALIATTFANEFGSIPAMSIEQVGYGAGDRDNPGTPNVLRILLGRAADRPEGDRVMVIECEIDDMNPQLFGTTMERLYAAGALEVFFVSVQMKKNRPGTLLTVVIPPERRAEVADIVFRETTTIGLRYSEVARECLRREIVSVSTPLGPVRVKRAWHRGRVVNAVPELEDCAALAKTHHLAVKEVQAMAAYAYGLEHNAAGRAL